jgi:hypothetical protein
VFRRTLFWSARAFDAPLHQEVPERLVRTALGHTQPTEPEPAPAAGRPAARPPRTGRMLALAASLALAVGLAAGWQIFSGPAGGPSQTAQLAGPIDGSTPLHAALERSASATPTAWASADGSVTGAIAPVLTFRAADGRYCREFESLTRGAANGGEHAAVGVACRGADGAWRAEVVAAVPPSSVAGMDSAYAPATAPGPEVIDRYLSAVMEEDALGAEAERELLDNGWR